MSLRNFLDKMKPSFEKGGKLHAFKSVFEGMETFLFVPNSTSKSGTNIHDAIDIKRIMSLVVIALIPATLFGMYNVGYQHYLAASRFIPELMANISFFTIFLYGFLAVFPKILVSYIVGLSIEFAWAQWKNEEIQEGYLVTGIIIPLIIPINCPLWMLALACAFAVIFAKEIFGGTGMNIFNVALVARAFLFFSYPQKMSGDSVWVADEIVFGLGYNLSELSNKAGLDAFTCATPLGELGQASQTITYNMQDMFYGLIPGSIGETSIVAIAIGAMILLWTGVASWKTMLSVFVGGTAMGLLFTATNQTPIPFYEHLILGGFAFGAVFMATDPVTSSRTEKGKYIYGFLIGVMAICIRVLNPGYPEGMMLAILLMNMFSPLIDNLVVQRNISKRLKRAKK